MGTILVWVLGYYSARQTAECLLGLARIHVRVETSMEVEMCDYSLEAYQSRPAAVGEKLILGRFASGSMGFAADTVCDAAACIPAESKLLLEGISEAIQKEHGVGAVE